MNKQVANTMVRKVLRSAQQGCRTLLQYPWFDEDGRLIVSDGYRIYRLKQHAQTAEMREAAAEGAKIPGERLNARRFFAPFEADDVFGEFIRLPDPDPEAVKSAFAARRANKHLIDPGPDWALFNADYFYDVLRLFPGAAWYAYRNPLKRTFSPVWVRSDDGDALLYPVRSAQKMEAAKTSA